MADNSNELKSHNAKEVAAHGCTGGCLGMIGGGGLLIFGVLLSLTGIGAIIGIPMIIMGFLSPLIFGGIGGILGKATKKGDCPYCGYTIHIGPMPGMDCSSCNKRVLVRNGALQKFDN